MKRYDHSSTSRGEVDYIEFGVNIDGFLFAVCVKEPYLRNKDIKDFIFISNLCILK